jgi:hypothetical protein
MRERDGQQKKVRLWLCIDDRSSPVSLRMSQSGDLNWAAARLSTEDR